ncbi:AAA family ATPase [Pusillimonas sp. TS35]|nr:AAA family ATPase [Pusillimonas sp. TS35]
MAMPIISAEERMKEKRGVKIGLFGRPGIGKTTLLKTMPTDRTLFVDVEAGDLAVLDWPGDTLRPKTWPEFRDLAVFLAGPNPALPAEAPFSKAHFEHVCQQYGEPAQLDKYDTFFVDSITRVPPKGSSGGGQSGAPVQTQPAPPTAAVGQSPVQAWQNRS